MRFIEHEGFGFRQQLTETFLAQQEIGEQQMMVDHHQFGLLRRAPRPDHVALRPGRAFLPQAVVGVGSDLLPERVAGGNGVKFGDLAGYRVSRPFTQRVQARGGLVLGEFGRALGQFKTIAAQIIGAPLEQRDRDRRGERLAHQRNIAVEELILQRLGAGGNHGFQPGGERGCGSA